MSKRTRREILPDLNSAEISAHDQAQATHFKRRFQSGTKPVIRWVKGDGLDDPVTKAAIAQATRLFGSQVDYCLCTNGISAERARDILEWASEPVEWWPVTPDDNPQLRDLLQAAGCEPTNFGYWWKWFPERVRPDAPEWILDGDMVITGKPPWFRTWVSGKDKLRVSQDDREPDTYWWRKAALIKKDRDYKYGEYSDLIDRKLRLYSGLISLPAGVRYMPNVADLLTTQPLAPAHDGVTNMSEQGVIAVAFQKLKPIPIPLNQFPFAHAGVDFLEYGKRGKTNKVWGYHFTRSFKHANPQFIKMTKSGTIFSPSKKDVIDKFRWLSGGSGQWGVPGWGMKEEARAQVLAEARDFKGKKVLDIGTSRGRLAASLAAIGCTVTTIDTADRGATQNLAELNVTVLIEDADKYLAHTEETFDLIVVDLHGNRSQDWQGRGEKIIARLSRKGRIILNNAELYKVDGWSEETGVKEFLDGLSSDWKVKIYHHPEPGLAVIQKKRFSR